MTLSFVFCSLILYYKKQAGMWGSAAVPKSPTSLTANKLPWITEAIYSIFQGLDFYNYNTKLLEYINSKGYIQL